MYDPCPPRHVLFVDDDRGVLQTLTSLLRKAGHAVAEAASGRAGLELFRANPADIVLTDFAMPDGTGWDVAQAVKALDPRVPVVCVTGAAHAIAPHQQRVADAILEKPCGLAALQTVIRRLTRPPRTSRPLGPRGPSR